MLDVTLSEAPDDFAGSAATVSQLILSLAAGLAPDKWEHDIAYNFLVHQGGVMPLGVQAFPHLVAVLERAPLDLPTREALLHLCALIFPASPKATDHRAALLRQIGDLLQSGRKTRDQIYLLAAYARVATADNFLADSLESLLDTTCPHCGEAVLTNLQESVT